MYDAPTFNGRKRGISHIDFEKHLPFKLPGERKGIFAIKLFAFLASGFSIPFLASAYQM
jgi:hypothetical protein